MEKSWFHLSAYINRSVVYGVLKFHMHCMKIPRIRQIRF